jgi:hypothetical protein
MKTNGIESLDATESDINQPLSEEILHEIHSSTYPPEYFISFRSRQEYMEKCQEGDPSERAFWKDENGRFTEVGKGKPTFTKKQVENARSEMLEDLEL